MKGCPASLPSARCTLAGEGRELFPGAQGDRLVPAALHAPGPVKPSKSPSRNAGCKAQTREQCPPKPEMAFRNPKPPPQTLEMVCPRFNVPSQALEMVILPSKSSSQSLETARQCSRRVSRPFEMAELNATIPSQALERVRERSQPPSQVFFAPFRPARQGISP